MNFLSETKLVVTLSDVYVVSNDLKQKESLP